MHFSDLLLEALIAKLSLYDIQKEIKFRAQNTLIVTRC
jgi:hypothetical protein